MIFPRSMAADVCEINRPVHIVIDTEHVLVNMSGEASQIPACHRGFAGDGLYPWNNQPRSRLR
jgi:hypothetical protein